MQIYERLNLNNVAKSSAEPNSFELCRDAVKNVQWTLVSRRNPLFRGSAVWGIETPSFPASRRGILSITPHVVWG